jgi:hypothetical protein
MFTGRAKRIRIIGRPDNQRPDEWSSTVLEKVKEDRNTPGTVKKKEG